MQHALPVQRDLYQFFFEEPSPEWGRDTNFGEGIGSLMMMGARLAKGFVTDALSSKGPLETIVGVITGIATAILSAPLTLIGAGVRWISSLLPHTFSPVTDAVFPRTSPSIIDQIYSLIETFDRLASRHCLTYWANGGTLLGARRHTGMIPWDDDGDFVINASEGAKLIAMKEALASEGINFREGEMGIWKLEFTEQARADRFATDEIGHIDLSPVIPNGSGKLIPLNPAYRGLYPKEYFLEEEISCLERVPFGPSSKGLSISVPRDPQRYLSSTYGSDCLEFAVRTHDHGSFFGLRIPGFRWSPVFAQQKVKIVDTSCAVGNSWK